MSSQINIIVIFIAVIQLFILNVTVFAVSHSSPNVINLEKNQERINQCKNWRFRCKNGQCIAKSFICNGLNDCTDGSDETYDQCQNKLLKKCDEEHFQCKYGACIEKKYQCDGIKHCMDESDESPDLCNHRIKRDIDKPCAVPPSSADKTVTYACKESSSMICTPSNGYVPEYTSAKVTCTAGHYREDRNQSSDHVCHSTRWLPEITKCLKKCEQLNPANVVLQCYRDGVSIPNCGGNSILLAGTKIYPSCKPSYKYDSPSSYNAIITCNKNGKWNNRLLPCIPECGIPNAPVQKLVAGGQPETIGGSPWHVAIFNYKKEFICGGTIITENVVLSAAHCFSTENCNASKCVVNNCEGVHCVDNFEVVVGKYTIDYNLRDNQYQRTMKIKEIRLSKDGFQGSNTHYAADLAILILRDSIPISPAILPACLNWDELRIGKGPAEGKLGKTVGWGRTENGTLSSVLRRIDLPFISYKRCVEIVDSDFQSYITTDKFCAGLGNRTGATLLDGDSGGGFLFEDKGAFYLQGVVSVKQTSSNALTTFTDLSKHINTIQSALSHVETDYKFNNLDNKTQEEVNRELLSEILEDIKSSQFENAELKLSHMDSDTYYYIANQVYNDQAGTFDLLLNFADNMHNTAHEFQIYKFMYNHTAVSSLNDMQNILLLIQHLKKRIIDRSDGVLTHEAQLIYDDLKNEIKKVAIKPISSAFLNYNSWWKIKKSTADITNACKECAFEIYNAVVETVWNKLSVENLLSTTFEELTQIEEFVPIHLALVDKLELTGALYTSSAITLANHMRKVMAYYEYANYDADTQSRYEQAINKLLQPKNSTEIGPNNVHIRPLGEHKLQLLSKIVDDIRSLQFSAAEQKLLKTDDDTYYHVMHKTYNNQPVNFNLLVNFGHYIESRAHKFKTYEFLYNHTIDIDFKKIWKLYTLMDSVRIEILDRSTTDLLGQKLFYNLKVSIIKVATGPISSAILNENSRTMLETTSNDIKNLCEECIFDLYNSVIETVWNKITVDDLVKKVSGHLRYIIHQMAVHLALANKLLNTSSKILLADTMKRVMGESSYLYQNSDIRSQYEEARNRLLQPTNSTNRGSNLVPNLVHTKTPEVEPQLLTEIEGNIKYQQIPAVEQKWSQIDPSTYDYILQKLYNNQTDDFDSLLNFGDSTNNTELKFKTYNFLYNKTLSDDLNDWRKLLKLRKSVKTEILNQTIGSLEAQNLCQNLENAIIKIAVEFIDSAYSNDNLWSAVKELDTDLDAECPECSIKVYNSVVEMVWNKLTLHDLLNRTHEKLKSSTADVKMHLALINKLESSSTINTTSAVTLAIFMKQTMNDSGYTEVSSGLKTQHQRAKDKLPQSVKNLVFSSVICIKNTKYNEYLYAGTSKDDGTQKNDGHLVYTWVSRNEEKPPKLKWHVSILSDHRFLFLDNNFKEYLYVGKYMYDDFRRYTITWNTNIFTDKLEWDLEVDENYIHIKNKFYQEYLCADDGKKKNGAQRYVFTYRRGGRTANSKWQIDDCS